MNKAQSTFIKNVVHAMEQYDLDSTDTYDSIVKCKHLYNLVARYKRDTTPVQLELPLEETSKLKDWKRRSGVWRYE